MLTPHHSHINSKKCGSASWSLTLCVISNWISRNSPLMSKACVLNWPPPRVDVSSVKSATALASVMDAEEPGHHALAPFPEPPASNPKPLGSTWGAEHQPIPFGAVE